MALNLHKIPRALVILRPYPTQMPRTELNGVNLYYELQGQGRPVFVFVHEGAALITIGAFIIHLYMGLFMVPGSTDAMLHGSVTAAWARSHHRLWYERVVRKQTPGT